MNESSGLYPHKTYSIPIMPTGGILMLHTGPLKSIFYKSTYQQTCGCILNTRVLHLAFFSIWLFCTCESRAALTRPRRVSCCCGKKFKCIWRRNQVSGNIGGSGAGNGFFFSLERVNGFVCMKWSSRTLGHHTEIEMDRRRRSQTTEDDSYKP